MIPPKVQRRARAILQLYAEKKVHPRKLVGGLGLAIEVGYRWRLLSQDHGESWRLVSHEKYNKLTRGKKPHNMR